MTPERWQQVRQAYELATGLSLPERSAYLARIAAGDLELSREVESLLIQGDRAESEFLKMPAAVLLKPELQRARMASRVGNVLGAYQITETIGHGGMGEVYGARRVDGQYEKAVAIKLVRGECDSGLILERFRQERQILATLDHPNIARLLDGGTTDDGVPYLVMELIDGTPIDQYCNERKLSISNRLVLFRQVCAAVHYAHQHLIVHRDLKPSNILVTAEGVPKLLDFGIAKIANPSGGAETTLVQAMTPEYASPEQIRGAPITTASDVYSLGVVLYQLLTGRSPYRVELRSPASLAEAVTRQEPERPSDSVQRVPTRGGEGQTPEATPEAVSRTREGSPIRLQRRLRGDLDYILPKALRKEPDKRYGSVEQLSEDIRRHLQGLPISARKGTWSYRAGKFVRGHRVSVAAAALTLVTLLCGIGATLHEARIAEANRRRAEARFNDVRKLANSLMFEVHDSIGQLPGATAARELIIERAQEYLDVLTRDSQTDPGLLRELAAAYARLASVQGFSHDANLGQTARAIQNYRKAVELLTISATLEPSNRDTQRQLARAYQDLGLALFTSGDKQGSRESTQQAVRILEPLAKSYPEDEKLQFELGAALEHRGSEFADENDWDHAGEYYQRALAILQRLGAADPEKQEVQTEISFVHKHIGSILAVENQLPAALQHYRTALAIDEAVLSKAPGDSQALYNITFTYSDTGWILRQQGHFDAALDYYSKALKIRAGLAAADPNDVRAREGLSNIHQSLGSVYSSKREFAHALRSYEQALAIRQALSQRDPDNEDLRLKVAESQAGVGEVYADMAHAQSRPGDRLKYWQQARSWTQKALPLYRRLELQGKLKGNEVEMPAALAQRMAECDHSIARLARLADTASH